ncbi:hypothetical protein DF186_24560, partial [Enterococcus hirae]
AAAADRRRPRAVEDHGARARVVAGVAAPVAGAADAAVGGVRAGVRGHVRVAGHVDHLEPGRGVGVGQRPADEVQVALD